MKEIGRFTVALVVVLGAFLLAFVLTMRAALVFTLVPVMVVTIALLARKRSPMRTVIGATALVAAIAAAPFEVVPVLGRGLGVSVVPTLWGTPNGFEAIDRNEVWWGGCVVPPYPSRFAVLVFLGGKSNKPDLDSSLKRSEG